MNNHNINRNTGCIVPLPKEDNTMELELLSQLESVQSAVNGMRNIANALLKVEEGMSSAIAQINRKTDDVTKMNSAQTDRIEKEINIILEEIDQSVTTSNKNSRHILKQLTENNEDLTTEISLLKSILRREMAVTQESLENIRTTDMKNKSEIQRYLNDHLKETGKNSNYLISVIKELEERLEAMKTNTEKGRKYAMAAMIAAIAAVLISIIPYLLNYI